MLRLTQLFAGLLGALSSFGSAWERSGPDSDPFGNPSTESGLGIDPFG